MATIDTLRLSRVLRDRAGFSQDAAEALGAAIGGEVATKADIAELKAYIDAQLAGLRAYIDAEIAPLKADMRLLRWQIAISWALSLAILVKLFVH